MNCQLRPASICMLILALCACGTTSNIKPGPKPDAVAGQTQPAATGLDLSGYEKIVVLDFTDATDKSKLKPEKVAAYSEAMAAAVRTFPDLIAKKVRETGAFQEVVRGPGAGKALVLSGHIDRLVEGNGALRLLVGMGAGSSYFDATTALADAETGTSLGLVTTDKNSWALGGGIAAGQTVQSFMQGAAEKIAKNLKERKQGATVASRH
jgi:hypothetical protein